jgi:CpeS-like protein
MTIQEFLKLSAGKWFSQRTSHQLTNQQSDHGSSDIVMETLAADHPEVLMICEQHQVDPSQASSGIQVTSQTAQQWNAPKNAISTSTTTLLVPITAIGQGIIATADDVTGQLLWTTNRQQMPLGKFMMGADDALTLLLANQSMQIEERIWFASPNLRLRTSVQKSSAGWSLASFCSEIRMGGQPSAA